jgi:diaminohydroxyphosphoribosylaminopyrimidine deaminase/5-amino-6-(5-phosphoribosylamino)uracil reductase
MESRRFVHGLRSKYDAVLVGAGTVEKDNPSLTVRMVEGRNPKRVVADANLNLKLNLKLFKKNSDKNLIILTSEKSQSKRRKLKRLESLGINVIFIKEETKGMLSIKSALKELGKLNVSSLLIEGGSRILTSFIKENLFDDMLIFMCPRVLGCGVPSVGSLGIKTLRQAVKIKVNNIELIGDDVLVELLK